MLDYDFLFSKTENLAVLLHALNIREYSDPLTTVRYVILLRFDCDTTRASIPVIRWAFGPSACRYNGQRVLFSVVPGDPSSPKTSRYRIVGVTLATLWRSKARFLMDF